jgi:hypothetical protein
MKRLNWSGLTDRHQEIVASAIFGLGIDFLPAVFFPGRRGLLSFFDGLGAAVVLGLSII